MLTKRDDPAHKQKAIYSLTEPSIELVPIMAALGTWGSRWRTPIPGMNPARSVATDVVRESPSQKTAPMTRIMFYFSVSDCEGAAWAS